MSEMRLVTPLAKIAVAGGVVALAYNALVGLPLGRQPAQTEEGYVNQKSVKTTSLVNANGKVETYLEFTNGETHTKLPIYSGPNGPLVGDADYYWSSIGAETKSRLVTGSWGDLLPETRQNITLSEIEKILKNHKWQ